MKIPPGAVDGEGNVDNSPTREGEPEGELGVGRRRPKRQPGGQPAPYRRCEAGYLPRTPVRVAPSRPAPPRPPPTIRVDGRLPTTVAYCSRTSR